MWVNKLESKYVSYILKFFFIIYYYYRFPKLFYE